MYKWVTNAYTVCILAFIPTICTFAATIIENINDNRDNDKMIVNYNIIYALYAFSKIYIFVMFFVILSLINIKIFNLIIYTFEFWYKMINLTALVVSDVMLQTYADLDAFPLWLICIGQLTTWGVFCTAFMADALLVSNIMKKLLILVPCTYVLGVLTYDYFVRRDYTWNPFAVYDIQCTQISFKSIYLSCMMNLFLFLMKPVLSAMVAQMTICLCASRVENRVQHNVPNISKFWFVNKRPFVHFE